MPTSVRTGISLSRSVLSCGSALAFAPARRVEPKAASFACFSLRFFASAKKAMSRGLEPGKPPSM